MGCNIDSIVKATILRILLTVTAIAFLVAGAECSDTGGPIQRITTRDKVIILHESDKEHAYDLEEDLQLSDIDTAKLLFQKRAGGKLYLLMHIVGPSVGGGNGQCGAGQEEYLVWMVLDSVWNLDDQKLQLIASCFQNIEGGGSDPYVIRQGKLVAEYVEYREYNESVTSTLTYDSAKPENAWTISHKHFPGAEER